MGTELLPHLDCVQIKEFNRTSAVATEHEVASIVEFYFPNRGAGHVGESVGDAAGHEIPNFDVPVASTGHKVGTSWVEVDSSKPVLVALSSHDVLAGVHVPNLPETVITGRCKDLLAHMQSHTANSAVMSFNFGGGLKPVVDGFVFTAHERVRPRVLGVRSHLGAFTNSALTEPILAEFGALLGTIVSRVNLLLNFLFISFNLFCKLVGLALKLIFLKLNQSLLLNSGEMLFLHLINALTKLLILTLDGFNVAGNNNFLPVDTVLVMLVEIALLPQLFPG